MKLKNAKKGVRVILKENCGLLHKGDTGTLLENNSTFPYISWDGFTEGHNGCDTTTSYEVNSVYCVSIKNLKRVKY